MNEPYFCRSFFLTDWRHKRLKNKIGLLLFYREHFYEFSETVFIQYAFFVFQVEGYWNIETELEN